MKDLAERISKLSAEKRKKLELKLEQQGIDISRLPITPVERKKGGHFPLSFAQERLWFIHQLGNAAYNIVRITKLQGHLDKSILEKSINEIIRRHEILRTIFITENEKPVQVILPGLALPLEIIDLKGHSREEQEQKLRQVIRRESLYSFDLASAPLLRAILLEYPKDEYLFLMTIHHIITDGFSLRIFERELVQLYDGFSRGKDPASLLTELTLQYVDYACWERQWLYNGSAYQKKQEKIWLYEFSGEIPVLTLPTDYPRPKTQDFEGSSITFNLDKEKKKALNEMASTEKVSLYILLLAIFNVFLSKLSGMEDIVIGTVVAGRRQTALQNIMGMFIKTLPLRNYPYHHKPFKDFLVEVKQKILKAFDNQEYQYEELVGKVLVDRDISRNPLYDVMFSLENMDIYQAEIHVNGLTLREYSYERVTSIFDMTLIAAEVDTQLCFTWEYCTNLFKEETIRRFIGYFKKLVSEVINEPAKTISEMEILPGQEKDQVLFEFNRTAADYPGDKTIYELFEEQVDRTPNHIAVVGNRQLPIGKMENVQLTYGELNCSSNQLARYLCSRGIKTNHPVGLMAKKSIEMIVAVLGILKAGCAYVPLDPKAPMTRNAYILEECRATILLTNYSCAEVNRLSEMSQVREVIDLCRDESLYSHLIPEPGTSNRQPTLRTSNPANLIYIIFTSGSTGNPKGVPITHANLCPLLHWGYKHLGLGPNHRTIQNLAYYFDWSVWEIFITLTRGACLYTASEDLLLNPGACIEFMELHAITVLHITPTQYQYLVGVGRKSGHLKYLFIGAEKLNYDLVRRSFASVNQDCRVFNMYGPTEATIISAVLEIHRSDYERFRDLSGIPIGVPAANTSLLILDKQLNLCPVNTVGELYIGGDGVARGYLNNPELTAEKFDHNLWDYQDYHDEEKKLPGKNDMQSCNHASMQYHSLHPITPLPHSPIYRTGDLARWLQDGNIEFMGRIDLQVKIRGFRIETGEIETLLLKKQEIKEAVVLVKEKQGEDKYLCAYIVFNIPYSNEAADSLDIPGLREYLSKQLPDYMIPSYFIAIKTIPRTGTGKIDRKALPEPQIKKIDRYIAPRNMIEEKIIEIWAQVLAIEKEIISADANFFRLGGHSIKAAVMAARIHKKLKIKLPLTEIFKHPSLKALASILKEYAPKKYAPISNIEQQEYYDASDAQKRVWVLSQSRESSLSFNIPGTYPFKEEVNRDALNKAFQILIERHESLRTVFFVQGTQLKQKVLPPGEMKFYIGYTDLRGADGIEKKVNDLSAAEADTLFDLTAGPLLRVTLVQTQEKEYQLLFNVHHIIFDFFSLEVLRKEVLQLYASFKQGRTTPLKPLRIQYKDYTYWHNNHLQGANLERLGQYWQNRFKHKPPVLELPYDKERPRVQTYNGEDVSFNISAPNTKKLRDTASQHHATLFMVLSASVNTLLFHYTGQTDITIGTPVAGREHVDLVNQIGLYLNTLALRTIFAEKNTFTQLLHLVKNVALDAYAHQQFPFDRLVDQLKIKREASRHPLFDVMVDMLNLLHLNEPLKHRPDQGEPGEIQENEKSLQLHKSRAKTDLIIYFHESAASLRVVFEYNTDLFERQTIIRMISRYKKLLSAIIENPDQPVADLQVQEEVKIPAFAAFGIQDRPRSQNEG